ncbi:MAG: ester cyclase [Lysobacter sp.]
MASLLFRSIGLAALLACALPAAAATSAQAPVPREPSLLQPTRIVADADPTRPDLAARALAARRYASFWNSGDPALARAALAPGFIDRTLPPGRTQGLQGPLQASQTMRKAIPDLHCEIEQLVLAGDRAIVHLRFRGHFSGRFGDTQGRGQAIDFIATDIYRIGRDRIDENWHIEDNLSLLKQMGVIAGE